MRGPKAHTQETKDKIAEISRRKWDDPDFRARVFASRNHTYLEKVENGKAECVICHKVKLLEEFPKSRKRRDGAPRYAYCKPCHAEYQRIRVLAQNYNLTPVDRDKIFIYQENKCGICGKPPKEGKRLAIDHDHKTGLIRGGLCWMCNRVIGMFSDDKNRLQKAIDYINNPPAVIALGEERFGMPGRLDTKRHKKLLKKQLLEYQLWKQETKNGVS